MPSTAKSHRSIKPNSTKKLQNTPTKDTTNRVPGNLTRHIHQDRSASSTHSNAGDRRNPGRNDELTWNSDSFICSGQVDILSDYTGSEDSCPVCEAEYERAAMNQPRRTVEFSLADIPMRVVRTKSKKRQACSFQHHQPNPQVQSIPLLNSEEPPVRHELDSMSDISWEDISSDEFSAFSGEDWEDLESTHSPGYELDQDLNILQLAPNDSNPPSTTPPRMTYAQVLGGQLGEGQK